MQIRPFGVSGGPAAPPISKMPSEYFTNGNIYVGCEAAEKSLP
jgi:hypothetical protein